MIKNNDLGKNFLDFCTKTIDFTSDNHLLVKFDKYIGKIFPNISHTFLSHEYLPKAYGIEVKSEFSTNVYKKLMDSKKFIAKRKLGFIIIDEIYIFPIYNLSKKIDYIIAFSDVSSEELKVLRSLNEYLQILYHLFIKQRSRIESMRQDEQANLISHITHDFNSLNTLIKEEQFSNDLIRTKITYAEKLMQDLIFYIRDLDIYKSEVSIKQLLEGILENVLIPGDIDVQISMDSDLGNITVDVELINKALSLVLENSIRAASQGGRQITFRVKKKDTSTLFFQCSWLEMIISDNGPGIPNDYLSMITEPFFTTFKDQGFTGFGLPLADKIISAHDGILTIEQSKDKGIKVIIQLPL